VQRWRQQVPDDFRFCLKLPRDVTHNGALLPQLERAIAFSERMADLGQTLGPMFAQLPPTYGPRQVHDLDQFLGEWGDRTGLPLAVEVRHPQWFAPAPRDRLNAVLRKHHAGRVLLDTRPIYTNIPNATADPQRHSQRRKPNLPLQPAVTADYTIVRFISHPERSRNAPFLQEWANRVQRWLARDIQVFFFVHCPIEDYSPNLARIFYQQVAQLCAQPRNHLRHDPCHDLHHDSRYDSHNNHPNPSPNNPQKVPILPLPWDQTPTEPAQLTLFEV
jgi:uncharacterized protein YecE (DUF72 family)